MNYQPLRKTYLVSIIAVFTVMVITWKLSGLYTDKRTTKTVLVDGEQRCNTAIQQLKWIKTHPNDKVSKLASFIMNNLHFQELSWLLAVHI